jgi:hypothetical protein
LLALRSLWIIFSLESWWRYRIPLATPLIMLNRAGQSSIILRTVSTKGNRVLWLINKYSFVEPWNYNVQLDHTEKEGI